jgi:uncharacterized protein YbaA (DUF1428 family)
MSYVQGFVIPVRNEDKEAYREMAAKAAPIFLEHGATRIVECWGDDVPKGKVTDFFGAVQAEEGENVVFSWVIYPDRATYEAAHEKIFADPRMEPKPDERIPFNMQRMIYGCFAPIFDTETDL